MLAILLRDIGSYSYAGMGYANPHAVTSVGGTTYTYDNNGNVTAIGPFLKDAAQGAPHLSYCASDRTRFVGAPA